MIIVQVRVNKNMWYSLLKSSMPWRLDVRKPFKNFTCAKTPCASIYLQVLNEISVKIAAYMYMSSIAALASAVGAGENQINNIRSCDYRQKQLKMQLQTAWETWSKLKTDFSHWQCHKRVLDLVATINCAEFYIVELRVRLICTAVDAENAAFSVTCNLTTLQWFS